MSWAERDGKVRKIIPYFDWWSAVNCVNFYIYLILFRDTFFLLWCVVWDGWMDGWALFSEQRLFYLWCVRTHCEQQSNGINRKQDAWLLCAAMRRERVCEFREILTYLALLRQSRALLRDEMMFSSSSSRPSWAAKLSVCETREDECWSDNGILG